MKSLLTAGFILLLMQVHAQRIIRGKLVDSASKHALSLATVSVFKATDTTLITYRLSTTEGDFRIPGIPLNVPCRLIISFSGYAVYRKEFMLSSDTTLDVGTIGMTPVSSMLDEVLVYAERPPVTVRKDTIEFNANSFKTLPSALVEDLLKKLPGVQVDADGNITANGKKVNRILVDGKAFFGDDPKMATRNLPANVIDKVQLADDKEEADRNIDGDLTNVGKVINLTLKKGMKKGLFGKLYGSAGTEDRYEAGGIVNTFRDTLQLSVLAFSNNVNRSGFSLKDVQDLGGFNRSGYNSMMSTRTSSGQQGFAINGISFGGIGSGISRTTGAGFNLNHAPNKKFTFYSQYFFGNTRSVANQINNTEQFLHDTTLNTRATTDNVNNTFTHTASIGSNMKPDSLTDINLRAGLTYTSYDEDIASLIKSNNSQLGSVSQSNGNKFNHTYSTNYNHSVYITRRFKAKKGRTLNIIHSLYYTKSLQRYITETENTYYYPSNYLLPFNQLRRQDIPYLQASFSANFAEPITKKLTVRLNTGYNYLLDKQDIGIYDKNGSTTKYDVQSYLQSSGFRRAQNRFNANVSLSYKYKLSTFTAGVNAMVYNIQNEFKSIATPIHNNIFGLLPTLSFTRKQFSVNYNESFSIPGIRNFIPVPDSTNPFYIVYGNPYLKPGKSHSFSINNYNFFQGSASNLNYYVNGTLTDNDVITSRTVNPNGVQTSSPVNASGSFRLYSYISYNKDFKNSRKFILSLRVSPYVQYTSQKLIVNAATSTVKILEYGPSLNVRFNWNDIVELNPQYSPGVSKATYTNPSFTDLKTVSHYFENELIVRVPKKLVWETNVAYRYNSVVAPGLPKSNLLWNAGLTYLFLKDDKGQLKFSVFDILNRNNNFYRYTSQNSIIDQQTKVLTRYGMLTFTYNIRTMGTPKKVGGKDRMFMF